MPNLVALRNAIAREIDAAKVDFPDHHAMLDKIGDTLDLIPGDLIPDFCSLDASTNGAVSTLLREDIRSVID